MNEDHLKSSGIGSKGSNNQNDTEKSVAANERPPKVADTIQ